MVTINLKYHQISPVQWNITHGGNHIGDIYFIAPNMILPPALCYLVNFIPNGQCIFLANFIFCQKTLEQMALLYSLVDNNT